MNRASSDLKGPDWTAGKSRHWGGGASPPQPGFLALGSLCNLWSFLSRTWIRGAEPLAPDPASVQVPLGQEEAMEGAGSHLRLSSGPTADKKETPLCED